MNKSGFLIASIFCFFCYISEGQILKIGDECPTIEFKDLINNNSNLDFCEFKNKLLILDFFATWCTSCITALPRYDSLQKKYKEQLQIILVTDESAETFNRFRQKHSFMNQLSLPVITSDTILSSLFPHHILSHIVWINQFKIIAITNSQYVINENISKIIKKEKIYWPVKDDFKKYDYKQPLVSLNEMNIPDFSKPSSFSYSAFTSYMPGQSKSKNISVDSSAGLIRLSIFNHSIIDFYRTIFKLPKLSPSNLRLYVMDSSRFIFTSKISSSDLWKTQNEFCYEAVFPFNISEAKKNEKILSDLNFYFGVTAWVERDKSGEIILVICENNGTKYKP